ncbi:MAG: sel1 repeat family protein, partial [Duncaniella sp.]|nr:sel1 repeat family protein [Duncaniella sp.]
MKKLSFFIAALALAFTACDSAESLTKDGVKALNEGNYQAAVENFNKAIEKDPQNAIEATRMLGLCYADSLAGEKDNKKAFGYFTTAAEAGDTIALYRLGRAYDLGLGTLQDNAKAVEYYSKAAELGNPDAMAKMAFLLYNGYQGVTKDEAKAVEYAKA